MHMCPGAATGTHMESDVTDTDSPEDDPHHFRSTEELLDMMLEHSGDPQEIHE